MLHRASYGHATILAFCLAAATIALSNPATAEEQQTYVFDRMWPTLKQPWYFNGPVDVASGKDAIVYVADTGNHRIQRFTRDGGLVSSWGAQGSQAGQFNSPLGVTIDSEGNVFVADSFNHRIQKFSASDVFLAEWELVKGEQLSRPNGLAVGPNGNVYVADGNNNRIQVFTNHGVFQGLWGSRGVESGEFQLPIDVAIDKDGFVYVADCLNNRVQKFDDNGNFVLEWGMFGNGDGQFESPVSIAIDGGANVYVSDADTWRVQKFTDTGQFLNRWEYGEGEIHELPAGLSVAANGDVYVCDGNRDRILVYSPAGYLLAVWEAAGNSPGKFDLPSGLAIDDGGNIYVADQANHRIQTFNSSGVFVSAFGRQGTEPGEFEDPVSISLDGSDNLYVTDSGNHRVQKFTIHGSFITAWGTRGVAQAQFDTPGGLAVDANGDVYVADGGNHRVQKFSGSGEFITSWGRFGGGDGQFKIPRGIAVDDSDNIYVADYINGRVQKFTSAGEFVTSWGSLPNPVSVSVDALSNLFVSVGKGQIFKLSPSGSILTSWGSQGSGIGEFNRVAGLALDSSARILVSDVDNHRLQRFRSVDKPLNAKAIIVAGGGPFLGNFLWDSTRYCTNFAYRTLAYQGFNKTLNRYLSPDNSSDFDNNGLLDDVFGNATNAEVQISITQWASGADSLVLYLADHGGNQTFRMSGTETLNASDLDTWLDQVDPNIPGPIIVVYEACQSGSFLDILSSPNRIIITSSKSDESANFLSTGTISFSSFFWTYVFNGATVQEAFDAAVSAVGQSIVLQHPQMSDPDNLAATTYIGNGTKLDGDAPVIDDVSDPQVISGTATAEIVADPVTDVDGVSRVWAVIQPPDYVPPSLDNPVQNLPSIELFPSEQDSPHWSGTYDGFTSAGTYTIAIYATDRQLNTSSPKITSVSVNSPLARKAIILAGGVDTDPLWPGIQNSTLVAYNALKAQGYSDDTIRFYSPITFNAGVDGLNARSNLQSALTEWGVDSTQDVVVYLCGNACGDVFAVNATESVSATQLDTWLDSVQASIAGKVAVIIDASNAGQFVTPLVPPNGKSRIVITGAGVGEAASFESDGDVSFSNYFWRHVLNGATVEQAFRLSATAIRFSAKGQEAQLDDNGNGIANEKTDGILSRFYRIGSGIQLAADDPLIGSVSPTAYLADDATSSLTFAENVTTTGTIERVWAEITPPGVSARGQCAINLIDLDFLPTINNRFEAQFDGITQDGTYTVAVFAKDAQGNISIPSTTYIKRGALAFADIDSNDANDAVDIQLVINAALNFPIDFDADVDRNTNVDAVDVQLVINAALGLS
jgi:sugar lactone lactonase YvrE